MEGIGPADRTESYALLALLCAALGCGSTGPAPSAPTDDVPMKIAGNRFIVPVQVGNAPPFDALLDTGSAGLRVLAAALPASAYEATTTNVAYGYGSDLYIYGIVGLAPVTLGNRTTPNPIPIMVIEQAACPPGTGCDPMQVLDAHFSGLQAILGVGMRTGPHDGGVGNPIAQLEGHPPFVVHTGGSASGSGILRIGALPSDPFAFATYPLKPLAGGASLLDGTPSWNDVGVPSCVAVEPTGASYCLPSLWDTGAPEAYVSWPGEPSPYVMPLPLGSAVGITLGPQSSTPSMPASYRFVVGPAPTPGQDLIVLLPAVGQAYTNPGIGLFFRFDALFDQEHGVVGLASLR